MTRTWLIRILRGTAAAFLVGALLGGVEVAIALRTSVTEMVNALQRLQLFGINALLCGGLAAAVGLVLSAAIGASAGHTHEIRALAIETKRDPRHPWLPWVLGGAAGAVLVVQILPWMLSGRAGSDGRGMLGLALGVIAAAAFAVGLRLWLRRLDYTGKGAGLALLGLPTLLVITMSLSVSASMAGGKGSATRAREGVPNILLITIDGLRADHLGPEGLVRTPSLDWLARKGVVFTQVITPSTAEAPPLSALMTGRHPLATGFLADGQELPERLPGSGKAVKTLAQELAEEGYATGAFVSSAALDGRDTGLSRGFAVYDDGVGRRWRGLDRLGIPTLKRWFDYTGARVPPGQTVLRPSAETLLRFEYWLAYHYRENFFSWVHLTNPRMTALYADQDPTRMVDPLPGDAGRAYGARVVLQDEILGELFKALEEDGLLDWTFQIVVAGSRGAVPDGRPTVDEPWVKVPVLLYGPGLEGGGSVDAQVRLQDLAPTILSAAGFRRARMGDGVSLVPLLEGGTADPLQSISIAPPRASDGRCAIAMRGPDWKYTREPGGAQAWYELDDDPKELENVIESHADDVARVGRELSELLGREVPQAVVPELGPGRAADLRGLDAQR